MYPGDETHQQGKIQPIVYLVRVNGDEVLSHVRSRLRRENLLTEDVQQYTLLQDSNPGMRNALCMVYPYKQSASEIDDQRLNALAQRFSTTMIFVIGKQDAIKRHTLSNIIQIPVEQHPIVSHFCSH